MLLGSGQALRLHPPRGVVDLVCINLLKGGGFRAAPSWRNSVVLLFVPTIHRSLSKNFPALRQKSNRRYFCHVCSFGELWIWSASTYCRI